MPPGDPSFARAQERLARTAQAVEASGAPRSEQLLFLQAESLYRYRFEPPSRSAARHLAEAAAVVVELPVFQALAGSLDLRDLRLRAGDGAVQLWETMLARHPTTALRPLVLYRLGWAYRNAGASGLPRESGDGPLRELEQTPGSPLAPLAVQARSVPWKSKDTAATLSLVPGLGQLYVGEMLNGTVRLTVTAASLAAIVVPSVIALRRGADLKVSQDWPLLAVGFGGFVVLSFNYTSSYDDAMRGVVEWNERSERAFEDAHPEAP